MQVSDDLLRAQAHSLSEIELENQNGTLSRHLLEVWVTELFPQSRQVEAQLLRLVFDKTQLSLLQAQLLELELPQSEIPSIVAQS